VLGVYVSFILVGFLGFREGPALIEALSRLRDRNPNLVPECVLVDGNGILHPHGCGLASHVGQLMCFIKMSRLKVMKTVVF
jgi:deoxyinosine 3'endonuclease (endonuclease V)